MKVKRWGSARSRAPIISLGIAATAVALATATPLLYLLVRIHEGGWGPFFQIVSRGRALYAYANTAQLVLIVTLAATILGIATAIALERLDLPAPRLWWVLAVLPLAVPSYVAAFALLTIFPSAQGMFPTALVLTLTNTPYVTVPALAALRQTDHNLADVARTTGRGSAHIFWRITLPSIAPAVASGSLLVALYALADFGTPSMLRLHTMTTGVYAMYSGTLNRGGAASLALMLALVALMLVALERWLRHNIKAHRAKPQLRAVQPKKLSAGATVAVIGGLTMIFSASVLLPIFALLKRLWGGTRFLDTAPALAQATLTTLVISLAVCIVATACALPIAILSGKYRNRTVAVLEAASFTGHALPGIVVALSLVFLGTRVFPAAYQTYWLLLAALVVLFLPKAIGSVRSGLMKVPPALAEVARSLGRSPLRAWWSTIGRGATPGIIGGAVLVMVAVMKELPATLMLRPMGTTTLATELWSLTSIGAYGAAAPIALLLIGVGLVPALVLAKAGGK